MAPKRAAKRKGKRVAKRNPQTGGSLSDYISKVNKIAKDTKIISNALTTLAPNSSIAQGIAGAADQLGYGRKRKQRGRGIFDSLGSVLGSIGHGVGAGGYGLLSGLTGGSRSINSAMIR